MILGPVMLDLGLHPLVAASTSLLLVGASSSTATIQFALGDRLEYGWGIIMFSICIVASLVGVAGFGKIVRKSGRASLIVFLLFFLMAGGGIMTLVSHPLAFSLHPQFFHLPARPPPGTSVRLLECHSPLQLTTRNNL